MMADIVKSSGTEQRAKLASARQEITGNSRSQSDPADSANVESGFEARVDRFRIRS